MNLFEHKEPEIARKAARAIAAEWRPEAEPQFIRAFSNYVYLLPLAEPRLYLRITPVDHRSEHELASELELVRFLKSRGIPVSEPVPSLAGRLVHTVVIDGNPLHGVVFAEAPGVPFTGLSAPERRGFFRLAGETIGRLHHESRGFTPSPGFLRTRWWEDRWARFPEIVPEREKEAWNLYREIQEWTRGLSHEPAVFGHIHGDLTIVNMRILPGRVTLFDFDSCSEHWFGYEIAAFLHYFGAQDPGTRRQVYDDVLRGYASATTLDDRILAAIPLFGKMRLLYSFLVFAEMWGFEGLLPEQDNYFAIRRRLFGQEPTWPGVETDPIR